MELRENLELVSVDYENNNQKAVFTFLDRERKQIRTVNFNRQSYDSGKFYDDPEKAAKVDEWCQVYFQTPFNRLSDCVGRKMDVYCYDRFNSLWEVQQVKKFTVDMVGQVFQTEIKEISIEECFIKVRYDIDGETYESKMSFGQYMKDTKEWFQDPIKKEAQYARFEDKFGVPVSQKDTLIGHPLMVEVKSAFGSNYYGDMKKFPKKK